jgi:hypothetical protein
LFFDATKSHEKERILNNKLLDYATEKQNMKNNIERIILWHDISLSFRIQFDYIFAFLLEF